MTGQVASAAQRWWLPSLVGHRAGDRVHDLVAGLSAGAVVIPQAMAYATIANLPVQVGLYSCIVPMLVYAVLGGSRSMSVSTTSTIATLTATTLVSTGVAASSTQVPRDLLTLTLLVGLILVVARLLRLGSLVEIINHPTLVGIQLGVGATVAAGQLPKLLGEQEEFSGHGFVRAVDAAAAALPRANLATVVVSVVSIAILLMLRQWVPRLPAPLVVVAAGIVLSAPGWLPSRGVALIAPVPQTFPVPGLPGLGDITGLLPGALAISVMAFLESAAVARTLREPSEPGIDTNQELLATASANVVGGFFSALPAAGGFSQSAVNKAAGARSQVSSLVTVLLAVVVGLFLGPVLSLMPQATLASLVFVAVLGLLDVGALRRLWVVSRRDFWVAVVTGVVGLTAGLVQAVAVGVGLTLVLVLQALNKPRVVITGRDGSTVRVRFLGPLYTANVRSTELAVIDLVAETPDVSVVVLDMSVIQEISVTVLDALSDLDRELAARGMELQIVAVPEEVAQTARRTDWFRNLEDAGRAHTAGQSGQPS